jgi:hypothetical protein
MGNNGLVIVLSILAFVVTFLFPLYALAALF